MIDTEEPDDEAVTSQTIPSARVAPPDSRPPMKTLPFAFASEGETDPDAMPLTRRRQSTLVEIAPPPSEPTSWLTTAVRNIEQAQSMAEAAKLSASFVCKGLGARAVLVLRFLPSEGRLRVIGGAGAGTADLLDETIASEEFVSEVVLYKERSLVVTFDDSPADAMHASDGDARSSILAVPVMVDGRCVGVIEVVNPTSVEGHIVGAVEHVARSLARFLAVPETSRPSGVQRAQQRTSTATETPTETPRYARFADWLMKVRAESR